MIDFDRLADRFEPRKAGEPVQLVRWAVDVLGVALWSAQREIADALTEHTHVAVKASHAIGKSKLAAVVMAWWIAGAGRPLGDAFAISTAPTSTQLTAVVWRELKRCHRDGKLPGKISGGNVPTWTIDGEIVALGRKPQDLVDVETAASQFQGVHARFPLAVIDEAGGCPAWVFDATEAVTTSEESRTLAIGNPTDPSSRFAEVCAPGSGWRVITVSAFDTPAFTGEDVAPSLLEQLVSRRWVEERRRRWGEDSPLYQARVMAEFPTNADDALIGPANVEAAQRLDLEPVGARALGCDVARSGSDETVIYEVRGGVARLRHRAQGQDTMATTGQLVRLLRGGDRDDVAIVDVIGVGSGVFDRLRELGLPARAFNSSERADRPDRFANRRAEAYWTLREEFRAGRVDLDPGDEDLAAQLVAIKYRINSRGQILIESKDEMRKRGVSSPDRADALAMAIGGKRRSQRTLIVPPAAAGGLDTTLDRAGIGLSVVDPSRSLMQEKW